jgi:hypothetical protein
MENKVKKIDRSLDVAIVNLIDAMIVKHIPIDTDLRSDLDGAIYRCQRIIQRTTEVTAIKTFCQ